MITLVARHNIVVFVVGVILFGSGCTPAITPTLIPTPPTLISDSATSPPAITVEPIATSDTSIASIIELAMTTASTQLNIPDNEFTLIDQPISVEWADPSLGCPISGETYAQRITPGYIVRLSVRGEVIEVHTDTFGNARICDEAGTPVAENTDPIIAEFIEQARTQVANETGADPSEILLILSESVQWSDSSLGCEPEEGAEITGGPIQGYRIELVIEDERYHFHADQQRMIRCDEPTE